MGLLIGVAAPVRGTVTAYGLPAAARVLVTDVWEVVRAVKSARAAEPDLAERELLAMLAENTGVPVRMIRVATGYWAAYPDEIDAEIAAADAAEEGAEQAWRRERELLGG